MTLASLNLHAALPEIALFGLLAVVLLADLFLKRTAPLAVHLISIVGLLAIGVWQLAATSDTQTYYAMNNLVVADSMSAFLKGCASLALAVTLIYGRHYIVDRNIPRRGVSHPCAFRVAGPVCNDLGKQLSHGVSGH